MASNARRDPVRELALLVRAPEPGSNNLGEFVANNGNELAQALGVNPLQLEAASALDDEDLAARVRPLLKRMRDRQVQQDLERRRARSLAAATRLGETARWTDLGAELDVDLLLGELLADRTKRWVAFHQPSGFRVTIARHLVAATAPLRRLHMDLAASVGAAGLHFRWRGGRGGYNWRSAEVDQRFGDLVLTVLLAPRVALRVPERRRGGAWLGQILRELGHVT
jgi:hypothetical protein